MNDRGARYAPLVGVANGVVAAGVALVAYRAIAPTDIPPLYAAVVALATVTPLQTYLVFVPTGSLAFPEYVRARRAAGVATDATLMALFGWAVATAAFFPLRWSGLPAPLPTALAIGAATLVAAALFLARNRQYFDWRSASVLRRFRAFGG